MTNEKLKAPRLAKLALAITLCSGCFAPSAWGGITVKENSVLYNFVVAAQKAVAKGVNVDGYIKSATEILNKGSFAGLVAPDQEFRDQISYLKGEQSVIGTEAWAASDAAITALNFAASAIDGGGDIAILGDDKHADTLVNRAHVVRDTLAHKAGATPANYWDGTAGVDDLSILGAVTIVDGLIGGAAATVGDKTVVDTQVNIDAEHALTVAGKLEAQIDRITFENGDNLVDAIDQIETVTGLTADGSDQDNSLDKLLGDITTRLAGLFNDNNSANGTDELTITLHADQVPGAQITGSNLATIHALLEGATANWA